MPNDSTDETLLEGTSQGPTRRPSGLGIDRRYEVGSMLGRGGMGEVRNAKDTRIHRDVAVKVLRTTNADEDTKARFLREAQVQGALDHPAIPPVHDLGVDRDGQPYFVMKKLAGTTLAEVLEARSSSDALLATWPRRKLLARLVEVCLAVELAHTKGIVHRDLKPANIMLGDYGETYVLDWGLARVTNEDLSAVRALSDEIELAQTQAGALLGTPGYMAPEQARGEPVDARADVYALGCILYEILTGAQALPRGLPALEATLATSEHRPSKRVDVSPELDALCARATAQDRDKRPSARELGDAIQAYLDGDRDVERRRELAMEHVERARKFLAQPGEDARAQAMREASRAVVLDATNTAASDILAKLVLEAPEVMPAGALADADEARALARQKVLRWGSATYASLVVFAAFLLIFPIKHVWPIATTLGLCAAVSVILYLMARTPLPKRSWKLVTVLVLNTILLILAAYIFGPLLVMPIFIVGSLAGFVLLPTGYSPVMILVVHTIAFAVPIVLELAGVGPSTFAVENGTLVLTPYAVELTPYGAMVIMFMSVLAQFVNSTAIGYTSRRAQEAALDLVHAQSWHFKQLLPKAGASDERR